MYYIHYYTLQYTLYYTHYTTLHPVLHTLLHTTSHHVLQHILHTTLHTVLQHVLHLYHMLCYNRTFGCPPSCPGNTLRTPCTTMGYSDMSMPDRPATRSRSASTSGISPASTQTRRQVWHVACTHTHTQASNFACTQAQDLMEGPRGRIGKIRGRMWCHSCSILMWMVGEYGGEGGTERSARA